MTLRQLWLRINVLIEDADSPLRLALAEAHAAAERRKRSAVLDDVHTRYQKKR